MNPFEKIKETFREGNTPLYFQFYLMLRNNILLGEIGPGTRIPPIEELNRIYGVSHATIRKAMALLEKEALITKRRGIGTMVRDDVDLAMLEKQLTESTFQNFKWTFLDRNWTIPPQRISEAFCDQPDAFKDGHIFTLRLLLISTDQPHFRRVVTAFIQAPLVSEIGEENFESVAIIEDQLNRLIDDRCRIDETLRPWICTAEMAELLKIADGTPIFHRTWAITHTDYRLAMVAEWVTTATRYSGT